MNRLRELRKALGMTQAALANHLGASQQTVARWEKGEAEPNFATLRDLATLLGTSVDDLLEYSAGKSRMTSQTWDPLDEGIDGFWGHIGLLLPTESKSRWYPITLSECSRVDRFLSNKDSSSGWLVLTTLNNKALIVNPDLLQRIRLLDDAADQLTDGDWELSLDSYQGWGAEVYRGISEFFWDEDAYEINNSQMSKDQIQAVIEKHNLEEDAAFELLEQTSVYLRSGVRCGFKAVRSQAYDLTLNSDCATPSTICLENDHSGEFNYFAVQNVALIEIPLTEYIEAGKEAMAELEG